MNVRDYLPSSGFSALASSIAISVLIILFAIHVTNPTSTSQLQSAQPQVSGDPDWEKAFASSTILQADASIQNQAQNLIEASKSDNLTETVGRALVINTVAAQGQGLGSDQPTQDQIISQALNQIESSQQNKVTFTSSAIPTVPDSAESLHAYGNALAATIQSHPQANQNNVMLAMSIAADNQKGDSLNALKNAAADYRALAKDVAAIETPTSLLNTELQVANNYARMADACDQMAQLISDPLKGVAGFQSYSSLINSTTNQFVFIAQTLQKGAILFNKKEPGAAWAQFLQAVQAQAQASGQ